MLPFPVPSFEQQRLEVLQRYRILSPLAVPNASALAEAASAATGWPLVFAAVTERHRKRFACHTGIAPADLAVIGSFCQRTTLAGEPFLITDTAADPQLAGHLAVTARPGVQAMAGAPLLTRDGERLGTLCLLSDRPLTASLDEDVLVSFAQLAAETLTFRSAARYAVADLIEAERVKRAYYDLAMIDPLTGVLNRRAFFDVASREVARSARHDRPLSVAALDIDHFKTVNDVHGHAAGDRVLAEVSACLSASIREEDALGRIGGEEFALLMPETTLPDAARLADRLRRLVASLAFEGDTERFAVTVSMGLSAPDGAEASIKGALRRADAALYDAKEGGRNRICAFAGKKAA